MLPTTPTGTSVRAAFWLARKLKIVVLVLIALFSVTILDQAFGPATRQFLETCGKFSPLVVLLAIIIAIVLRKVV